MADRCPHGLLQGSKLCVVPSCSEYDGQGSTENNVQKAKFAKRPGPRRALKPCENCGERRRVRNSDYCELCSERSRQTKHCIDCGAPLVCNPNTKLAEHIRRQRCRPCALKMASRENHVIARGLGVPRNG